MFLDAITESGTIYRLDVNEDGRISFWSRHVLQDGKYVTHVYMEKCWGSKVGTSLSYPWSKPEDWEESNLPVVGKHFYITTRNLWLVSTPISAIVEVDGWDTEEFPLSTLPKE